MKGTILQLFFALFGYFGGRRSEKQELDVIIQI
jgi:hypothetical protein